MKAVSPPPMPDSLLELLFMAKGDNAALIEPRGHLIRKYDYAELTHLTTQLSRGLNATNLRRGSKIALCCHTSAKAIAMSFAILLNGATNVVLPQDVTLEEQLQALSSSKAEALVVDNIEAAIPLLKNIKNLPQLRQILVLSEGSFSKQPEILCTSWQEILQRGEKQADRSALLRQAITKESEAFLYFHRDSSGRIKGQMHSHQDMMTQLSAMLEAVKPLPLSKARILGLVPFHYPQSFVAIALLPLVTGLTSKIIALDESWKIEVASTRKTIIIASNHFFETLHHKLNENYHATGGVAFIAWQKLKALGANIVDQQAAPKNWRVVKSKFWSKLLGAQLFEQMGGKTIATLSVDTPLSQETSSFLSGMGAVILPTLNNAPVMLEIQAAEA